MRRDGELVRLSTTEFELLVYLLRNRGRVLSREQILRAVWGYEYDPGTNVVDVYVGYLRRKLRRGEAKVPIVTVRSVGYRFDAADLDARLPSGLRWRLTAWVAGVMLVSAASCSSSSTSTPAPRSAARSTATSPATRRSSRRR